MHNHSQLHSDKSTQLPSMAKLSGVLQNFYVHVCHQEFSLYENKIFNGFQNCKITKI